MDMLDEGLIDEKTAVMRVAPKQLDELLHPVLDSADEKREKPIAQGLPAGPGGSVGTIVFTPEAAVEAVEQRLVGGLPQRPAGRSQPAGHEQQGEQVQYEKCRPSPAGLDARGIVHRIAHFP